MLSQQASDRAGFYASVVVHALFALLILEQNLRTPIYLPPLPMNRAGTDRGAGLRIWPKPDRVALVPDEDPRWNRFGDPKGKGIATADSPGELMMSGRQGDQDQPWLSRDPIGPNRRIPDEPSPSTMIPGQGGAGGPRGAGGGGSGGGGGTGARATPPMASAMSPETSVPAPLGAPPAAEAMARPRIPLRLPPRLVRIIPPPAVVPIGLGPTTQPTEVATTQPADAKTTIALAVPAVPAAPGATENLPDRPPTPRPTDSSAAPPRATASLSATPPMPRPPVAASSAPPGAPGRPGPSGSGRPGPPVPPADPAPQSDSESDPFSRIGSVVVRPGRVDARLGRAAKLMRPHITTKGILDMLSNAQPSVTAKVSLDATGKVTDVEIIKSSGSNEVDLPVKIALYESWIEPAKNKAGKAVPDVMLITYAFK